MTMTKTSTKLWKPYVNSKFFRHFHSFLQCSIKSKALPQQTFDKQLCSLWLMPYNSHMIILFYKRFATETPWNSKERRIDLFHSYLFLSLTSLRFQRISRAPPPVWINGILPLTATTVGNHIYVSTYSKLQCDSLYFNREVINLSLHLSYWYGLQAIRLSKLPQVRAEHSREVNLLEV